VRFGNVLGSRGSVVHTFSTQIERGDPITTPTRCRALLHAHPGSMPTSPGAASIGPDGEVMVLEMGEQVKSSTWRNG